MLVSSLLSYWSITWPRHRMISSHCIHLHSIVVMELEAVESDPEGRVRAGVRESDD